MTPAQLAATALAVACGAQPDEINDAVDGFMVAPAGHRPDVAVEAMRDIIAEQRRAWFDETFPRSSDTDAAVTRLHAEAVDRLLTEAAVPLNAYRRGEL